MLSNVPLSVLVLTKDEERNIGDCIDCVRWSDEIVVLDSFSTDATVAIAEEKGVRVVQREFDSYATQKNWALDHLDFKHEWILLLDADERITPPLAAEIAETLGRDDLCDGYYVPWRNRIWGRDLRHMGPYFNLRLVRRGKGRYEERLIHEHMIVDGKVGYLKNQLINIEQKGFERYCERHNTYTSLEAIEICRRLMGGGDGRRLRGHWLKRGPERRRMLKNLAYRYAPARPLLLFLYLYFYKRGFLDGAAGFRFCVLKMFFDYIVSIKAEELRAEGSPLRKKYQHLLSPAGDAGDVVRET